MMGHIGQRVTRDKAAYMQEIHIGARTNLQDFLMVHVGGARP